MVDVGRFQEAQLMFPKVYRLAVPKTLHGARIVPLR